MEKMKQDLSAKSYLNSTAQLFYDFALVRSNPMEAINIIAIIITILTWLALGAPNCNSLFSGLRANKLFQKVINQ